jgi:hypothetical protein
MLCSSSIAPVLLLAITSFMILPLTGANGPRMIDSAAFRAGACAW